MWIDMKYDSNQVMITGKKTFYDRINEVLPFRTIWKPFLVFCLIYGIAMIPLIRANFNYIDDLGRVPYGYRGWDDFARYIPFYLSVLIHAGTRLTDISPFTQVLAAIWVAFASVIVVYLLTDRQTDLTVRSGRCSPNRVVALFLWISFL